MRRVLPIAGLTLFLAACVVGCGSLGVDAPRVSSTSDAILVTSATIETVATELHALCGNEIPGGECLSGALVDTETKDRLAAELRSALDVLKSANRALAVGETTRAESLLVRADALLRVVQSELTRRNR